MPDFPSISQLIKKTPGAAGKKPASSDVEEKFSKKIQEIEKNKREELTKNQATSLGLPYIDLSAFPVSAEALRAIPEETAKAKGVICFFFTPEEMRIGSTAAPTDEIKNFIKELEVKHNSRAILYLISESSLKKVLKLYANLPVVKPVSKEINITDEAINQYQGSIANLKSLEEQFKQVSITDILTLMVASALKVDASDIHVEAEEKGISVRYRIDGVLHDVAELPKDQWKKFVSRIKLLAALKINIEDKPQDGRVTLRLGSGSLDIRVSTMPTLYGESVVMRILYSGGKVTTFDDLGLRGDAYARLKKEIKRPNGMIITTGPTGSGKTTTLYAILRVLNEPGVKIITLEDPIEIKMDGINQSQVDPSRDYTFAKGLRSILRQDPDICMVGEIRDLETADISIQAALTGHLMLSTIHTNSASAAIPRFLSMGVQPFLLAPSLNSIIGQRLVRRICEKCKEETTLDAEILERVKKILETLPEVEKKNVDINNLHFYHGRGCEACNGLGYKGRVGVYEIFLMNKELEQIILSGQISEYTIQEIAVKTGMVTMAQDGILKALEKITTVDEVLRVTEE